MAGRPQTETSNRARRPGRRGGTRRSETPVTLENRKGVGRNDASSAHRAVIWPKGIGDLVVSIFAHNDCDCQRCDDPYWVCEAHRGVPSDCGDSPLACGAPAMPCPDCNPSFGIDDPPKIPPGFTVMPEDGAGIVTSRWLRHWQFGQRKNTRSKIVATNTRLVGRDARKCISMLQSGQWSGLAISENKSSVMVLISSSVPPGSFLPEYLGSAA